MPFEIESETVKDLVQGHFVSPRYQELNEQIATQVNAFIKNKKIEIIIDFLRIIEPNIQNITTLSEYGRSNVYVDLGYEYLTPISAIGSGFYQYLRIILDAMNVKHGILVVDEIENGLHYSLIDPLLRQLIEISLRNDLQIFISTHSEEIIDTLVKVSQEVKFTEISSIQLWRDIDKRSASIYPYKEILVAEEMDTELR